MEEQFLNFLSDDLLKFCSHEDNYFGSSAAVSEELDALTNLSSKDVEEYFAECSEDYSDAKRENDKSKIKASKNTQVRKFALPKTDDKVVEARKSGIPIKTQKNTEWCFSIWEEWRQYRNKATYAGIAPIELLDKSQLNYWLSRFILEVRKKPQGKKKGDAGIEFPPNTLYHICCGLQRYLRCNGKPDTDFANDTALAEFKSSLDAEMKRLQSLGIGSQQKQAETLTQEDVEIFWEKKLLGDATPQSLLDTIVFFNGFYFALRSGQEHRQLRYQPAQIKVVENPGERPYLIYREDLSKNRPGGIKGRRKKPKVVIQHANLEQPERCFVRLFKLYNSLCPKDRPADCFYLQPSKEPNDRCWYSTNPYGHNRLAGTVARLCKAAEIPGHKTNHSLRATNATWLYDSDVDEQLIMERTGHLSTEGVRSYKRTTKTQQEKYQTS